MSEEAKSGLGWPALAFAIFVVGAWLLMAYRMFVNTGATDLEWSRLTFILTSVEAFAAAAAGAILGVQVQSRRVADAKKRADDNEEAAKDGKLLAGAILNVAPGAPEGFVGVARGGGEPEIVQIARRVAAR